MNLKISITRKHENMITRNPIQLESAYSIVFAYQEKIDFKTLFRYKKASTEKEEACQWDRWRL